MVGRRTGFVTMFTNTSSFATGRATAVVGSVINASAVLGDASSIAVSYRCWRRTVGRAVPVFSGCAGVGVAGSLAHTVKSTNLALAGPVFDPYERLIASLYVRELVAGRRHDGALGAACQYEVARAVSGGVEILTAAARGLEDFARLHCAARSAAYRTRRGERH